MWCDQQFAKHNARLELDATRLDRIESAVRSFGKFAENDEELGSAIAGEPFLQGSVASRTSVRPIETDEYDVDVVYPLDLDSLVTADPAPILDWFETRLARSATYSERMVRMNRCVRINYAGDFHMDIIPATDSLSDKQPYAVAARDLADWLQTDPVGFAAWVAMQDARSGYRDGNGSGIFNRSVRYLKRWRDHFFTDDAKPSSILLVTILGKHEASRTYNPPVVDPLFPTYKNEAAYLYDLLRLTLSCLDAPPHSAFEHPTNPGEDLGGSWVSDYLGEFLDCVRMTIDHLSQAISSSSRETAIEHYQDALGPSFPAS